MYSNKDFLQLEVMTNEQLKGELEKARREYEIVQEYYKAEEKNGEDFYLVSVETLIFQLKNVEAYISKAESILDEQLGAVLMKTVLDRVHKIRSNKNTINRIQVMMEQNNIEE